MKFPSFFTKKACSTSSETERWNVPDIAFRSRAEQLSAVITSPNYDVLIVGGGCSGVGALLSCARRNLRALLIDSHDFGCESSSTSMFVGGDWAQTPLWSLKSRQRLRIAFNERDLFVLNAPQMAEIVGLVLPCRNIFSAGFYLIKATIFHHFFQSAMPRPILLWRDSLQRNFPQISARYGVLGFDVRFDDARLVREIILTATSHRPDNILQPGEALNYARLQNFVFDEKQRVIGADIVDKVSGHSFRVNCKGAINTNGVLVDEVRRLANPVLSATLTFVKKDHLSLSTSLFHDGTLLGLILCRQGQGAAVVLPWKNGVTVGPAQSDCSRKSLNVPVDDDSERSLLAALRRRFPVAEFSVVGRWAELTAIVDGQPGDYRVERDARSRLVSVVGGCWSSFRRLGERAVESLLQGWEEEGTLSVDELQRFESLTTNNLCLASDFRPQLRGQRSASLSRNEFILKAQRTLSNGKFIDPDLVQYLVESYGAQATSILLRMEEESTPGERLSLEHPFTRAEVEFLAAEGLALSAVDLLVHHLRIGLLSPRDFDQLLPFVVEILGNHHGWDDAVKAAQHRSNSAIFNQLFPSA